VYHIHQNLESWVGRHDFRSRRFLNQTEEKGKTWERKFEIYPDSGFYREAGRDTTAPTVPDPLDDAAFLYWIAPYRSKSGSATSTAATSGPSAIPSSSTC